MFFSKVRSNIIKTENVDLYEERLKFMFIFCLGKQGGGGGYIFKILKKDIYINMCNVFSDTRI